MKRQYIIGNVILVCPILLKTKKYSHICFFRWKLFCKHIMPVLSKYSYYPQNIPMNTYSSMKD